MTLVEAFAGSRISPADWTPRGRETGGKARTARARTWRAHGFGDSRRKNGGWTSQWANSQPAAGPWPSSRRLAGGGWYGARSGRAVLSLLRRSARRRRARCPKRPSQGRKVGARLKIAEAREREVADTEAAWGGACPSFRFRARKGSPPSPPPKRRASPKVILGDQSAGPRQTEAGGDAET